MTSPSDRQRFDVIVIGAGVAGGLIADALSRAKLGVLIVEAGEVGLERGELVTLGAIARMKGLGAPYKPSDLSKAPGPEQPGPADTYYDQKPDPLNNFQSTYERRVGGTTWHWLGHTPRLLPNDFKLKSTYGRGVDWPLGYADIESYYARAERELGVAGDDEEWRGIHGAFRSEPFPMPKIWPSFSDLYVASAIAGLQIDGRPFSVLSTPSARNSQPYDGRPPCAGNSSCIPICPIGAKYDATVHVKKAIAAGAELRDRSVVVRLRLDPDGFIRRVVVRPWDGPDTELEARLVVLAAHAIETPKLLLMSACDGAAAGIANSSDQVGRNLMDHAQRSVLARAPVPLYPFRGPPSTSGIETMRDGAFRKDHSAYRLSLANDGWARSGSPFKELAKHVADGAFGRDLKAKLLDDVSRQFRISVSTEILPDPDNRVVLSPQVDASGLPRPQIHFRVGDYTRDAFEPALHTIRAILAAMKVSEPVDEGKPDTWSGAGHIIGTCRMGETRTMSVVDAQCRSHDHRNLYIVGAGAFPTCGTANPTLTVAALALRAADDIAAVLPGLPAAPRKD